MIRDLGARLGRAWLSKFPDCRLGSLATIRLCLGLSVWVAPQKPPSKPDLNPRPSKPIRRLNLRAIPGHKIEAWGAHLLIDHTAMTEVVFPQRLKVIFVNGCFWHGHSCARGARVPVHNRKYWTEKIARNKRRDTLVRVALKALGWKSLVIWECELQRAERLRERIARFLQ